MAFSFGFIKFRKSQLCLHPGSVLLLICFLVSCVCISGVEVYAAGGQGDFGNERTRKTGPYQLQPEPDKTLEDVIFLFPASFDSSKKDLGAYLKRVYKPVISALPDYSSIHFFWPENIGVQTGYLKKILGREPHLYQIKIPGSAPRFAQDLFELGRKTADGKIRVFAYKVFEEDNPEKDERMLNEIFSKYSGSFEPVYLPWEYIFEGGNIQIWDDNNGNRVAVIGSEELYRILLRRLVNSDKKISGGKIKKLLINIASFLGVEKAVMFPDNTGLAVPAELKIHPRNKYRFTEGIPSAMIADVRERFEGSYHNMKQWFLNYHIDVSVRLVHDGRKYVPVMNSMEKYIESFGKDWYFAFEYRSASKEIMEFFLAKERKIDNWLRTEMGYDEIIKIPFITPANNYSNFIAYRDRHTGERVILMQNYTYPEKQKYIDTIERSLKSLFKERGITVKYIKEVAIDRRLLDTETRYHHQIGGLHCTVLY